jgi:hypothetical protein
LTLKADRSAEFSGDLTASGNFTSKGIDDNATSTAITIDANENVGIGSTTPKAALDIIDSSAARVYLGTSASNYGGLVYSNGVMSMRGIGNGSAAVVSADATNSEITFTTAGVADRMVINSSGFVGIGTSFPMEDLSIRASSNTAGFSVAAGSTQCFMRYNNYWDGVSQVSDVSKGSASVGLGKSNDGVITLNTAAAGAGTPAERVRIDATGNVGIGTDAPAQLLSVGDSDVVSTNYIRMNQRTPTAATTYGGLEFFYDNTAGITGVNAAIRYASGAVRNDGELTFYTGSSGSTSEAMRIDSTGNVGIGTSNPLNKLVVSEGTGQHGIELSPGTTSYIQAYDRATADYGDLKIDAQTIAFGTDNGTERMRINALGNVGIGTDSPSSKLDLYDSSTASDQVIASFIGNGTTGDNGSGFRVMTSGDNGNRHTRLYSNGSTQGLHTYEGSTGNRAVDTNFEISARSFSVQNGAGTTEYMRVDSTGNIIAKSGHIQIDGTTNTGPAGERWIGGNGTTTDLYINAATGGQMILGVGNSNVATVENTGVTVTGGFEAAQPGSGAGAFAAGPGAGINQGAYGVAVGVNSGRNTQGTSSVAIGAAAAETTQGTYCVAVGSSAGKTSQGQAAIAVGNSAGFLSQGTNSIAIGVSAAQNTQGVSGVAIGYTAGFESQGDYSIALGRDSGKTDQGESAIAIGYEAGKTTQALRTVAIGRAAGSTTQASGGTAVGYVAAQFRQGTEAVALGYAAGYEDQGAHSIAIGKGAGQTDQGANGIIINSSGVSENSTEAGHIVLRSSQGFLSLNPAADTWTFDGGKVAINRSVAGVYFEAAYSAVTTVTQGFSGASGQWYVTNGSGGVTLDVAGTTWGSVSDETLKENISDVGPVLDTIKDFRCVNYSLKATESEAADKVGFIAQDWEHTFPNVVSETDEGTLSMKYTETIPVLLKAIQELTAKVEALENA